MKALVTGGAGFIGSNLIDALLDRGDDAVALDNLSTGKHENLEGAIERGARLVVEDIRDKQLVTSLVEKESPDVIFHLAAQADVRVSVEQPEFDAEINVIGTINMLEAARTAGAGRFIFASTGGTIYGEADELPCREDSPLRPEAPYPQGKLAGEGYCELAGRLHGLSTISLRFGNAYGPRQDPHGEAGVIAIFCGCLLEGKAPTVFGDGLQTRDYIYVEEIVAACLLASKTKHTGAFNVGSGVEVSVLDLVAALGKLGLAAGLAGANNFEPQFKPARPGEIGRNALDTAKSRAELGFESKIGLEAGLERTLESIR